MAAAKRIMKEWREMQENPVPHWTAGPIGDDIFKWNGILTGPPLTPYQNGIFHVTITFPRDYPFKRMKLAWTTRILHCQLFEDGWFWHEMIAINWSPAMTVRELLNEIVRMLQSPNPYDPHTPDLAKLFISDRARHDELVRAHTAQHATPITGSALTSDASEP